MHHLNHRYIGISVDQFNHKYEYTRISDDQLNLNTGSGTLYKSWCFLTKNNLNTGSGTLYKSGCFLAKNNLNTGSSNVVQERVFFGNILFIQVVALVYSTRMGVFCEK